MEGLVRAGGLGVIAALLLLFGYLVWVVLPLGEPARMGGVSSFRVSAQVLHLACDEHLQLAVAVTGAGQALFFRLPDGQPAGGVDLAPRGLAVTALAVADPARETLALALADGSLQLARLRFEVSYPGDRRQVTGTADSPGEPVPAGLGVARLLAAADTGETLTVAAVGQDRVLRVRWLEREAGLLQADPAGHRVASAAELALDAAAQRLVLTPDGPRLYLLEPPARLRVLDLAVPGRVAAVGEVVLSGDGARITALEPLLGGVSLLAGDERGRVTQWFPVRGAVSGTEMPARVREFATDAGAVLALGAEHRRRGFVAATAEGRIALFHTTSGRRLAAGELDIGAAHRLSLAPRGDALLALDGDGRIALWRVHNPHPEVSWSALWWPVWYEHRPGPEALWQSSAATTDFEPKLSFLPLTFGTLKGALYAMLISVPLGVAAALYTAFFMARPLRAVVKPGIEFMEALPTVILGFLAGLWLAPLVEGQLAGVLALVAGAPLVVLALAGGWSALPARLGRRVPPGWEALALLPVVVVAGWACFAAGPQLEGWLFAGDLRRYLSQELGIGFDQRNALVVGIAMAFAVIPPVFSIAEDAVFSVPRHLVHGALALGASPWQTLARVVLPTAASGIFSAITIGLGRAVGETMIVLMATGNTPILDLNVLQGMRTLAANVAIEMPESEVDSTHYRVLFLSALVLFVFTFLLNTLADGVRTRLRRRYQNL